MRYKAAAAVAFSLLLFCDTAICLPKNVLDRDARVSADEARPRFLMSALGNLLLAPFGDFFPIEIDVPGTAGSFFNGITGFFSGLFSGGGSTQTTSTPTNRRKKIKRHNAKKKVAMPR